MLVLDTHVLVWVDGDDLKLGRKSRSLLQKHWESGKVVVPAIVFWEIGLLHARRRLELPTDVRQWRESVVKAGGVEVPLDGTIALRALDLVGLPEDPADRFIVATALVLGATLMTADERLLSWPGTLDRHDART